MSASGESTPRSPDDLWGVAQLQPDNIVCGIIASQWLLTLFVHALGDEATASLWDVLFQERDRRVLFAGCLVRDLF
jgi:hypothetical protein